MSFILEALRKSEHERQRQAGPDFAPQVVVRKPAFSWTSPWVIVIVVLLVINVAVISLLFTRLERPQPHTAPVEMPAPATQAGAAPPVSPPAVVPPVTPPPRTTPPAQAAAAPAPPPVFPAPEPAYEAASYAAPDPTPSPSRAAIRQTSTAVEELLPTVHELGLGTVPELHLDLHVYADQPQERFVSINGRKYREGDRTAEGIGIERITQQGVVMNQQGRRFLLPR